MLITFEFQLLNKIKNDHLHTKTAHGEIMFTIFTSTAEFERTCMIERQAEGIEEAKKTGKYHGHKLIEINETLLKKLIKNGMEEK